MYSINILTFKWVMLHVLQRSESEKIDLQDQLVETQQEVDRIARESTHEKMFNETEIRDLKSKYDPTYCTHSATLIDIKLDIPSRPINSNCIECFNWIQIVSSVLSIVNCHL